jgi:hypothetical protein
MFIHSPFPWRTRGSEWEAHPPRLKMERNRRNKREGLIIFILLTQNLSPGIEALKAEP